MTKDQKENRRAALIAAAFRSKGDLRSVIRDAEVLVLWLEENDTDLAFELLERYED